MDTRYCGGTGEITILRATSGANSAAPARLTLRNDDTGCGGHKPTPGPETAAGRSARTFKTGPRMKIERKFTTEGKDAYDGLDFTTTSSEIRNPDGTIVFRLDEIDVPGAWSQVASDVIAQKYFRKAGVAAKLKKSLRLRRSSTLICVLWRLALSSH